MRLMLVGSAQPFAIEQYLMKYWKQMPVDLYLFNARDIFNQYYSKSVFNKLAFKSGFSSIYKSINESLKKHILEWNPELVLVFKGMELFPETLLWIKEKNIKLVNYNADNPFIFSGKGSGNSNVTNSIHLYEMHFTYHQGVRKRLQQDFDVATLYLPFGSDVSPEVKGEVNMEKEVLKVCFLGNPDKGRAALIMEMAKAGLLIDVYGAGWPSFVSHANISCKNQVYGFDFWKTLFKYRVQLNIMRKHNLDSHNMRSFEIPAIAGLQLAPDTPEHRSFFEENSEIFLYNDVQSCIEKAMFMLNMPENMACTIRENAYLKGVVAGYGYRNRAEKAYCALKDLMNG